MAGYPFEQSVTVSFAWRVIGREAFVFGIPEVLGEDRIEGLRSHQRGWRIESMRGPVNGC
jgi:hypothetical protein